MCESKANQNRKRSSISESTICTVGDLRHVVIKPSGEVGKLRISLVGRSVSVQHGASLSGFGLYGNELLEDALGGHGALAEMDVGHAQSLVDQLWLAGMRPSGVVSVDSDEIIGRSPEVAIERMAAGMVDCNGDQIFTGDQVRVVKDYPGSDDQSIEGRICWVHNWSTGDGDRVRVQDTKADIQKSKDWEWSSWLPADFVEVLNPGDGVATEGGGESDADPFEERYLQRMEQLRVDRRERIATAVLCAAVRADLGSRLWSAVSGNDFGEDHEEIARKMDQQLAKGSVQLADALSAELDAKIGGGS